jgi:hypothetical protein
MNIKRAFLTAAAVLMVPGFAMAQSTVTFSTLISDVAGGSPEMTITCNGGVPLSQSGAMGTTFTVTLLNIGDVCSVDLTGALADGYEVDYFACVPGGTVTATGCDFTMDDANTTWQTQVWVQASPADFYADVTWEISDEADEGVGDGTMLDVTCTDGTDLSFAAGPDDVTDSGNVGGESCVTVDGVETCTDLPVVSDVAPGESCTASLSGFDSATAVSPSSCTVDFVVDGGDESCSFTATAFYEGIPTLSQYGMAIMALLMLGVGFVGFRRFV